VGRVWDQPPACAELGVGLGGRRGFMQRDGGARAVERESAGDEEEVGPSVRAPRVGHMDAPGVRTARAQGAHPAGRRIQRETPDFFSIKFFGSGIVYPTGGCYSVPLCAVNSPARSLSVLKYRGTVIQGGWIQGAKGVCRVRIQVHCASGPCHPPQVVGGGQVLLSSR
jgi:hypothetical protein